MGMTVVRDSHFNKLNEAQRQAVTYGVSGEPPFITGPVAVIAGAGSGKTLTLTSRVAHLVDQGADPSRIMLLTFTRRAAAEMTRRVRVLVAGGRPPQISWSGTFHSIGARLLREYAARIGLNAAFTIHDRGDSAGLMDLVRQDLGYSTGEKRFPKKDTCLAIYSSAVNACQPLGEVLQRRFPTFTAPEPQLARLFGAYVKRKQRQNVLDYDDLLLLWAEMLTDTKIAAEIGDRFDHILIDEYQDTNRLQGKLLLRMKPDGRGVMVVGDDAQSIYSFRAAEVRNILDFPTEFDPPATVIILDQNYRSTQPILDVANAVMAEAPKQFRKQLRSQRQSEVSPTITGVADEAAQAEYVAREVLRRREEGISLDQQAILFRNSNHSAQLEVELARRNIPFVKFGGLKFVEAAHVKDVLTVLRWADNPRDDVSGFRVLQLLPRIGPATAKKLLDLVSPHRAPNTLLRDIPQDARPHWMALSELLAGLRSSEGNWPDDLQRTIDWYASRCLENYDDGADRLPDLEQLAEIAGSFTSRHAFLTDLALDPPEVAKRTRPTKEDEGPLTLSTIHSAKGREWEAVTILSAVDGALPSSRARSQDEQEEERRLFNVAITRAKDELELIMPRQSASGGSDRGSRGGQNRLTCFIPRPFDHLFQKQAYFGRVHDAVSTDTRPRRASTNVRENAGSRWDPPGKARRR
jgi:DNA helicase-2/ATP-dependent DNA helicase PcrA